MNLYLCDCAAIITRDYPIILIKVHDIAPNMEQVDAYLELLEKAISDREGRFILVVDGTLTKQTIPSMVTQLAKGMEKLQLKHCKRHKLTISVPREGFSDEDIREIMRAPGQCDIAPSLDMALDMARTLNRNWPDIDPNNCGPA